MDTARRQSRKERIFHYLDQRGKGFTAAERQNVLDCGFHAAQIAADLGIDRANVSRELNRLVKEAAVVKLSGKPVRYFSKDFLESGWKIKVAHQQFADAEELRRCLAAAPTAAPARQARPQAKTDPGKQIFGRMIGADNSLKNPIKQAIAAIIYPPDGLHTFLIGPTGVGKTTFAELMYRYAMEIGKLAPDAPYIVFNCADYAGNPQLLLSYLFGHVKGAFTGADKEKKGLIDAADGGILFLDEVHRLPPEGQEMLFSLTDRGKFRRLGESDNLHKANVRLILATTEDPEKNILKTFLRRIPCVINLPGLSDRPMKERMRLICAFFDEEAKKIKLPLTVSTEVLKLLLVYDCWGNIGQLKNDVQIACANAFVEYVTENKEIIYVKLSQMTDRFKEGFFTLDKKREELARDFALHAFGDLTFHADPSPEENPLQKILPRDAYRTAEDFYEKLLRGSRKYVEEGKSLLEIKTYMNREVATYFKQYPHSKRRKNADVPAALYKIVREETVRVVKEILTEIAEDLAIQIDPKIVYGLALHIETLRERVKSGVSRSRPAPPFDPAALADEYGISQKIKRKLEQSLSIAIPKEEAAFIAMFLCALNNNRLQNHISVLVLAHGDATASSMANVANRLLDTDHVKAVDMPLAETVAAALEKTVRLVREIDRGRGVMFMVDMGSLASFAEAVTERTGIPSRTIKMVSTPMVIEAARKSMMPNMTLDRMAEEVVSTSVFIGRGVTLSARPEHDRPAADESDYFDSAHKKMMALLSKVLIFLDAPKAYEILRRIYDRLLRKLRIAPDRGLKIKFMFHNMSMLERAISRRPLIYTQLKCLKQTHRAVFLTVKKEFKLAENAFGTSISDGELAYNVELLRLYGKDPAGLHASK